LSLLFIFLLLVHPSDPLNPSMASSLQLSTKRSLLSDSSSSASSTMNLNPKKTQNSHAPSSTSTRTEFESAAHDVPSGPNPISNR
ncbi:unnamed protein product, partial [Ilex paraguariensis]